MSLQYPETRTVGDVDGVAGVRFPDPYHWLEEATDEVTKWQRAQGEFAAEYVRNWPHFDHVRRLVDRFSVPRFGSLPQYAAGSWFRTEIPEGASQARVRVSDEPFGTGRVLFDATLDDPGQPPFVSWIAPSPDGTVLAFGVCTDGSEQNTIRLLDVETGTYLPDPPTQVLMDSWTGGVSWLADSSGFFFSALEGDPIAFDQRIFVHRRGGAPATELVDVPSLTPAEYRQVVVSRDGRHAVLMEGLLAPAPVALAKLDDTREVRWRPFVTRASGTVAGQLTDNAYVAVVTDKDAPRGRVVAIPLDSENPNDVSSWHELVAPSDAVVRSVTPAGGRLYLTEFVDTYARVRIVSQDGEYLGEVPLPGRGAIAELPYPFMNLNVRLHPEHFLFGFSSLTSSWGTYSYRPETGTVEQLCAPGAVLEDAVVEDRWALSPDGTRVPYHLVHRRGVDTATAQPSLIYGYGGLNAPWVPQFPGAKAAFVAAGGVFVHAHLRGGAEFGLQWWEGGRQQNKQNVFDDLYAIAEDLIASGVSSRDKLAVTGASNGGLLAGVAVTQRPDLWRAAVPQVPILDLVGACRDGYGRMVMNMDFADPSQPDGVRHLASFSPYQLLQDGTDYPAVFLDAGATDPRCPPWHARKFGARLQAAAHGAAPVLIRIWENTGHGWATDKEVAQIENAEWLAFVMQQLGLTPIGKEVGGSES